MPGTESGYGGGAGSICSFWGLPVMTQSGQSADGVRVTGTYDDFQDRGLPAIDSRPRGRARVTKPNSFATLAAPDEPTAAATGKPVTEDNRVAANRRPRQ